jgi:hypothetical protein
MYPQCRHVRRVIAAARQRSKGATDASSTQGSMTSRRSASPGKPSAAAATPAASTASPTALSRRPKKPRKASPKASSTRAFTPSKQAAIRSLPLSARAEVRMPGRRVSRSSFQRSKTAPPSSSRSSRSSMPLLQSSSTRVAPASSSTGSGRRGQPQKRPGPRQQHPLHQLHQRRHPPRHPGARLGSRRHRRSRPRSRRGRYLGFGSSFSTSPRSRYRLNLLLCQKDLDTCIPHFSSKQRSVNARRHRLLSIHA